MLDLTEGDTWTPGRLKRQRRLVALLFALAMLCALSGCARPMDEQLRQAVLSGKTDEVTQLLGQGADPGYQYTGWTVLLFATRDDHVEIVRTLLERGAKVDAVAPRGITALMVAAQRGHVEIVKALLARRAFINARNDNTALMYAAEFGHLDVAKALVEAGADLNVRDGDRETALGIARRRGHLDIVRLLTDRRAWE